MRSHRPPSPPARLIRVAVAALTLAGLGVLFTPPTIAGADQSLVLTTPYPSIETQPGSIVKLDITVTAGRPEPVDLAVDGLPAGWQATLRGGGFVIHSITSSTAGSKASLEIAVASDAQAGSYPMTVTATDGTGGRSSTPVTLVIAPEVNSGIRLTTDFPSLTGDPGGTFSYNLTVTNDTPAQQTFTFDPSGPEGWTVSASPSAEARAQTVTVEAGSASSVKVTATAPESVEQGAYPIDVKVTGDNGAQGSIKLEADVTGTPKLVISTPDSRLDVSGKANSVARIPLVVANTGTAPLEAVKLAGSAPNGWEISFEPAQVDSVLPGETAQVTAVVKPASKAVAGDYQVSVRSSAGSLSSNVDLRYALSGGRTLGILAVLVIAAAFAGLAGVFVKYGRR